MIAEQRKTQESREPKGPRTILLMSHLGQPDPRLDICDRKRLNPVLTSFFKKCEDNDAPTLCAHPATIAMLERLPEILDEDHPVDGPLNRNVINLCIMAFFWLMRPAEFCGPSSRNDDAAMGSSAAPRELPHDVAAILRPAPTPAAL